MIRTMLAGLFAVAAPAVAGGNLNTTLVGQWDGFGGNYGDVWAEGEFAYVGHFGSASIDIVDISNPANPVRVVEYFLPPPNTDTSAQDLKVHDGLLFIGLDNGGNSAHIVDVRDPENPVGLVDVDIAGFGSIHNLFYADGYLYLVTSRGPAEVAIVDLTDFDPDNPPKDTITTSKWILRDVGGQFVHDITVVGGRMYACAWDSGIWIYDVTDIANQPPRFLGDGPGENTHSSWPTDDGRFVITGEERTGGGITVYRIIESDGGSVVLEITDTRTLGGNVFSVHNQAVIGNRVYNAWYEAGLRVYDVDPATGLLSLAATFDTSLAWGIYPFLGTDRVLISDISDGLFVLDVDAPLPCPADIDGDGQVAFGDILEILSAWGPCKGECPQDLDGDGQVAFGDILIVLAAWGPCE